MKYFGTDGIRGIVGQTLTKSTIKKLSKAVVKFYNTHKLKPILLVGNDSRISSDYILSLMQTTLLVHGIEVHNVGVCSSPCLAYLTRKFAYPLGMMISASHNPHEYNGIKFFNSLGEKISEQTELELERFMDKKFAFKTEFALSKNKENLKADYINFLRSIKKHNLPCVVDCAFGGASDIAKIVFPTAKIINHRYTGKNINLNAGCTQIEFLRSVCMQEQKIGFAFDGDADRLLAVDERGEIYDGDKIMFILSQIFQNAGDTLVGTIYSNSGLEKAIRKRKIKFERAMVGDKLVYKKMSETKASLGGENSGHIIIKQFTNTGDGVLNAIVLMNILGTTKKSLSELTAGYTEYFQAQENIKLNNSFEFNNLRSEPNENLKLNKNFSLELNKNFSLEPNENSNLNSFEQNDNLKENKRLEPKNLKLNKGFELSENTKTLIDKFEDLGARIIIRPSGTEPVLRLMVEHKDEQTATKFLEFLKSSIE